MNQEGRRGGEGRKSEKKWKEVWAKAHECWSNVWKFEPLLSLAMGTPFIPSIQE